jgi:phage terminase large subunit-like protein
MTTTPTSTRFGPNLRAAFDALDQAGALETTLASLAGPDLERALRHWPAWAREAQLPPEGDWATWAFIGGRGAGKTRAGAEWVRGLALGLAGFAAAPVGRIALVGETLADVRDVMIEGVSGVLAVHLRGERPVWQPSRRRLDWGNGAIAQVFSSEDPESLRGPQFDAAWADELAKWRHPDATWDMLQFGLRLGDNPRALVTTTPRPIGLLKRLLADPTTRMTHATTRDNAAHLGAGFVARIEARYGGSALGRQELDGALVEDRPGALWTRDGLDRVRVRTAPALMRIVVAVDPPATSGPKADACGIIACGLADDGIGYVLVDQSIRSVTPDQWAARAVALFHRFEADALVVEVNQGGDMVSSVIAQVDPTVPVSPVRATRGKYLRAEPVATLYTQGRVRHVGAFPDLEDEMADFAPGGLSQGRSPDRLDALVWALSALMLRPGGAPRVRRVD